MMMPNYVVRDSSSRPKHLIMTVLVKFLAKIEKKTRLYKYKTIVALKPLLIVTACSNNSRACLGYHQVSLFPTCEAY